MSMSDRNEYGFPVESAVDPQAPLTCGPGSDHLPTADLADDEEPDTWREELPPEERGVFDRVMDRSVSAIQPSIQPGNIAWCVEEALWQLRCIAKHATTLHIPGAGTWKRCG